LLALEQELKRVEETRRVATQRRRKERRETEAIN
jgi:hypothetical protein